MLTWLIVPTILIWVSLNYLLGSVAEPKWKSGVQASQSQNVSENSQIPEIPAYYWNGQDGLVTLWFDDAWISQYDYALPVLEQNNFKAAIAVPTGHVGYEEYTNWYQLKRLQFLGWEITSHSVSHGCEPENMSWEELEKELLLSKQQLAEQGLRNSHYVAPCGKETFAMNELSRKHYHSLRGVEKGLNSLPVWDPYNLKIYEVDNNTDLAEFREYITQAKESKSWLIIVFHIIDDQNREFTVSKTKFLEIIKEVKNSNIPVVLPSQVIGGQP